jgi:hypothetical protein
MDKLDINQINPKYWGNHAWIFLNSIGLTYNPENKKDYEEFYSLLGRLLPCSKCQEHVTANLDKLPDALDNKLSLLNWLLSLRNGVDKSKPMGLNDLYNEIFYDNQTNECIDVCELPKKKNIQVINNNKNKIIFVLLFILCIFIIIKIIVKIKNFLLKKSIKKNIDKNKTHI